MFIILIVFISVSVISVALVLFLRSFAEIPVYEELESDFSKHSKIFISIKDKYDFEGYLYIDNKTYDKNDTDLVYLFSKLDYNRVIIEKNGDIFFGKYEDWYEFRGIVFTNNREGIEVLKSNIYKILDEKKNWFIYSKQLL